MNNLQHATQETRMLGPPARAEGDAAADPHAELAGVELREVDFDFRYSGASLAEHLAVRALDRALGLVRESLRANEPSSIHDVDLELISEVEVRVTVNAVMNARNVDYARRELTRRASSLWTPPVRLEIGSRSPIVRLQSARLEVADLADLDHS